jgi:hypothetical protein
MAVPPIQYRTTDYPPKYRPLGYWRHAKRHTGSPDEGGARDRGRRRFLILLAVLVATLVLHAGIAVAYLGSSGAATSEKVTKHVKHPGASCAGQGQQDPAADQGSSPDDVPSAATGGGKGSSELDPSSQGGGDRGAL